MQRRFDSEPAAPVEVVISDEPQVAPVAVSFTSEPPTEPLPRRRETGPRRASALRRLLGWAVDASLLALLFAAHVFVAARLCGETRYWLDLVLAAPLLWLALLACLAVGASWPFVSLCARTPGMALTGQRLRSLRGEAPRPLLAFVRAVLAVVFAAPGLFGFVLALFDERGQTLHDKLSRCVTIVD
jgi:hypothetical protein